MNIVLFLTLMIPGTLFLGIHDTLVRKILRKDNVSEQLLLGFQYMLVSLILSVPLFTLGIPEITPGFWSAILITSVLNIFANWAWYAAFKREEASLVSPLRLLTPPIVILTGYLVLREVPTAGGVAGILMIVSGLWFLLQSEAVWRSVRIREVIKRPGVLLGLWGAISFGLSFPFDKKAVVAGSALLTAVVGFMIVGLANTVIVFLRGGSPKLHARENWREFIALPFVHSASAFLTYAALPFALAAYAVSVKRLWSFWAVLLSGKFLKEENIGRKLLATIVMLAGIAMIAFFG